MPVLKLTKTILKMPWTHKRDYFHRDRPYHLFYSPQPTFSSSFRPSWAPRWRDLRPSLCRALWRSALSAWNREVAEASCSSCPSQWWVMSGEEKKLGGGGQAGGDKEEDEWLLNQTLLETLWNFFQHLVLLYTALLVLWEPITKRSFTLPFGRDKWSSFWSSPTSTVWSRRKCQTWTTTGKCFRGIHFCFWLQIIKYTSLCLE